jgi:hypothetical protein
MSAESEERAAVMTALAKGMAWLNDRAIELSQAFDGAERKRLADQLRAFADRLETL